MKVPILSWFIMALVLVLHSSSWAQAQPQTSTPPAKQSKDPAKLREEKPPARPPRVVTDLSGFDLLDPSKTKKQTMVAGATRGMPRATALAPKLAKLYGSNPLFRWSYPGKAQKFVFVLMDDSQAELLRTDVSGTEFRYPAAAPQFAPGKTYFWTVEPSTIMLAEPSSPVGFVAIPAPQRQEMEQRLMAIKSVDAYAAELQRAQVFTDQRLWYDAIGAYTDLIGEYPDRAELYEWRGTIFAQFEATQPLADNDFARAEELEAKR
jgi:hypothetical protein